jgi:hypothetical protein
MAIEKSPQARRASFSSTKPGTRKDKGMEWFRWDCSRAGETMTEKNSEDMVKTACPSAVFPAGAGVTAVQAV